MASHIASVQQEHLKDYSSDSCLSHMEKARLNQDKTLNSLGLYRFKIVGDGNCMFRAIGSQLHKNQSKHNELRREAVEWMKTHIDQLIAGNLVDSENDIIEIAEEGVWAGQATLVALANILNVNIAIIYGGDQGNIDIQHISPDDSTKVKKGIMISYLYTGHYDAILKEPSKQNPEYEQWMVAREELVSADDNLARNVHLHDSTFMPNIVAEIQPDTTTSYPNQLEKQKMRNEQVRDCENDVEMVISYSPLKSSTTDTRTSTDGSKFMGKNVLAP